MSAASSIASGLRGAVRLACGQSDGVARVEADDRVAIHSFWAIALCLPPVLCMRFMDWYESGVPPNAPVSLARYLILFVVGWLLFVLASHHMARSIDREKDWPRFIAIWSYCSVIENILIAAGGIPGAIGAPPILDEACQLITLGWAFWLEWYSIGLSLRVGPLTATIFLAVDIGIGIAMALAGGG
jgi:hypothetical protein